MGMEECSRRRCGTCARVLETDEIPGTDIPIQGDFTCDSSMVVYLLICTGCDDRYVGKTRNKLKTRYNGHRYSMNHEQRTAISNHYKYYCDDPEGAFMLVVVIDQADNLYDLRNMEGYWQDKLDVEIGRREGYDGEWAMEYEMERMNI